MTSQSPGSAASAAPMAVLFSPVFGWMEGAGRRAANAQARLL